MSILPSSSQATTVTEALLSLVPLYGLFLIGSVVVLTCLAVPLPASMLVMASGGFAAAGDLILWQVIVVAFTAFVIGDQLAFTIARWGGARLSTRLRNSRRRAVMIDRAEGLVDRWGALAVVASRTILSPLGPTVSYICGGMGLDRLRFSVASVLGAALWSAGYPLLGYGFAERIDDIGEVLVSESRFVFAFALAVLLAIHLWRSWKRHSAARKAIIEARANEPAD